jgi:cyclic pyranopterin phosphate synthase
MKLTHFDKDGNATMVDVSKKNPTLREAKAQGYIKLSTQIIEKIKNKTLSKGDVLTVAQIAGIMGAKNTSLLIPLCHNINLDGVNVEFEIDEKINSIKITAIVRTTSSTGVEMEALNAVSIAALTIYDMVKAVEKSMVINDIKLIYKTGGKSGDYYFAQGEVESVNISVNKGTIKMPLKEGLFIENYGLENDAHSGNWHRQVSLLASESIDKIRGLGVELNPGKFAENITTKGIELHTLPVGTKLMIGETIHEITQIGKECHAYCEIKSIVGDCVMPREGIFTKVLKSGVIKVGDKIQTIV